MSDRQHHIMVVGAHCGDAEVMAGGIVAKYTKSGHKASIGPPDPRAKRGTRRFRPKSTPSKNAERPRPPQRCSALTSTFCRTKSAGAARQRRGEIRAGRPDPPGQTDDHPHPLEREHPQRSHQHQPHRRGCPVLRSLPAIKREASRPRSLGLFLLRKLGGTVRISARHLRRHQRSL